MRIVHLLQSHRFSGAENVICQIIELFRDEKDFEMLYSSRDGQIREALVERNIPFIPISDITVDEVKRVIKKYNPDIIHAHDMRASYVAARACHGIPLISHIHNNNFDSRGLSVKAVAYFYAAIKAKHIFWVSDSSYNGYVFHSFFKNKSEVLYNVIDINALYKKMSTDNKQYDYDIVYLGRLTHQKNPLRLMNVFKQIINIKSDVKIAVIGTGEMADEVHAEAEKLKLGDNVEFLGFMSNPYKILHDAKIMILTSLWEGTPMCVLEAMSLGVPVVSTPTDGVKVVIKNGVSGILCDTDEEIVKSCLQILSDPNMQQSLSICSVERVKRLMNIDNYKKRIHNAYIKAMD